MTRTKIKHRDSLILWLVLLLFVGLLPVMSCKTPTDLNGDKGKPGKKLSQVEQLQLTALFIDATRERSLDNVDKAMGLYAQCVKRDPSYAPAMYEMARIFEERNQLKEARIMAISAMKYEPDNEWYMILLAGIHIKLSEYPDAVKILKSLTDRHPETPDYLMDLANVYLLAGKVTDAIKTYDAIEKNFGISEEVSLEKEKLWMQSGKINKAIDEIENLLEADPGNVQYMGILAELYLGAGNDIKGLDLYHKMLLVDPTDPYVHLSLAEYYRRKGMSEKTFEELSLAFQNPAMDIDHKVRILLNYFNRASGDTLVKSEGFQLCAMTVEAHPNEAKAWSIYGDFYYMDEKLPEARNAYRRVVALDSLKYVVWEQLMIIDVELKDYEGLEQESAKAMEIFPDQAGAYLYNGFANIQLKNYPGALKSLRTGLSFAADSKLILKFQMNLGDLLYEMADYDGSFEAYEKALKIDPENKYVLEKYPYRLALQNRNLSRAENLIRKLTQRFPGNMLYEDAYAYILFRLDKFQEAKERLDVVLAGTEPPNAVVLEHYGDILFKLNQKTEAVKYWKQAKEAGASSSVLDKKIEDERWYE